MKKTLAALSFFVVGATCATAALQTTTLTEGWSFAKGEKAATETAATGDDSGWAKVRIPHDWAIAEPFDPNGEGSTGKLPWRGVGCYRKTLRLDEAAPGTRAYLDFDGVMAKASVFINGQLAGTWDYGYTGFRIDATPYVSFGADNVIAVVADTRTWNSRWYPGAGLYRKVTLELDNPVHLSRWGQIITNDGDERTGKAPQNLRVRTKVENHLAEARTVEVETTLTAPDGSPAGVVTKTITLPANGSHEAAVWLPLSHPVLWDVDNPALYTLKTTVRAGNEVLDTSETRCGIRTFAFTEDDGFHLNGKRVEIHGVNLHSDLGPLGMAFNRRAAQRQLEIMKDMGVNALRTSHNPPAPEMLDLCDEMGLIVWDEAFDKWDGTAGRMDNQPDLSEFARRHIASTVMRDRNHPSIVIWSIGNEIPEDAAQGVAPERVARIASFAREFDMTRPVAMGCCDPNQARTGDLASLDMTGWNYGRRYEPMRAYYPEKPLVYSESASAVSTRGYYEPELPLCRTDRNMETLQISSYDYSSAPWSDIPDAEFARMTKDRYMGGEFVWTGIDYLGEPTPFDAEARSSYFGPVDLAGMPKDRFYLYRSLWNPGATTVHILPHWNWEGMEGRNIPVFVYTNGASAELFLNGKSLGRREKGTAPKIPADRVSSARFSASTSDGAHAPEMAADNRDDTFWKAAAADENASLTIDLGSESSFRSIHLSFEREEKLYAYTLESSKDGQSWTTLAEKPTASYPMWGGVRDIVHPCDTAARYLRLRFGQCREEAVPAVRTVNVFAEKREAAYYDTTYDYRLRWNEVPYEKGELKAIAYDQAGKTIGETVIRTAGKPAKLRLTPDRTHLDDSGDDLSFILVEATDKDGNICPLAMDMVHFAIEGAGAIAGMENGNPLCFESMQGDSHSLFYGKEVLVIRAAKAGTILVKAAAEGMESTEAKLVAE
jgi:beta-galactosidase